MFQPTRRSLSGIPPVAAPLDTTAEYAALQEAYGKLKTAGHGHATRVGGVLAKSRSRGLGPACSKRGSMMSWTKLAAALRRVPMT